MHLLRFVLKYERGLARIDQIVQQGAVLRSDYPGQYAACLSHAVIALHDLWANACRSIVLASAKGRCITRGGRRLGRPMTLDPRESPIGYLRKHWTRAGKSMPITWEPDWFVPEVAIRAARLLNVGNSTEIMDGLGATVSAEPLRITRNVVAHSLPNTWERLRRLQEQLGISELSRPEVFVVLRSEHGVGTQFLYLWSYDLKNALMAAIK